LTWESGAVSLLDFRVFADFKMMLDALPNLYTFDVVDFSRAFNQFKKVASENDELLKI